MLFLLRVQIKEALINGKAKSETYLSAMVTHAVVSDHEHYEMDAAKDVWQIPTVKVCENAYFKFCLVFLCDNCINSRGLLVNICLFCS